MTNAAHTVICLHLHDGAYLVGYLVKDDDGAVIIAPSIHPTSGTNYQQVAVRRDRIEQCYSIPIVWWQYGQN